MKESNVTLSGWSRYAAEVVKRVLPWLFAGFISLLGIIQAIYSLQNAPALVDYIYQFLFVLVIILFALLGALIVVHEGGNRVGWMMMLVALVSALPIFYDPVFLLFFYPAAPSTLSPGLWLLLWIHNWFWLLQIIPIFQIVLHFPDGRPPSARWNWINIATLVTLFLAALMPMFKEQIGPLNNAWHMDNPLGFVSSNVFEIGSLLWTIGLLVLAIGSLTSLFTRYKLGGYVEREQIKWLLFAGAVLITFAAFGLVFFSITPESPGWLNILSQIALMVFPIAIANAILRYRLYDIDIIIRRTLQYTLLTVMLALLYFLGVVILQGILGPLIGETNSPPVIVVTTLGIAALFNPLRTRVQGFIDRRFYRRKYDAVRALDAFAASARDETDVQRLTADLIQVVQETLQPNQVHLWLKDGRR